MKGLYLGACYARHNDYDIVYNDIDPETKCDLVCDMLSVDLDGYDFYIATPPCNFWSKANPYYKKSEYALMTKDLLPRILCKLAATKKPFIVENVKNYKRFKEYGIFDICETFDIYVYPVGRHLYFTNLSFIDLITPQVYDFKGRGIRIHNEGYKKSNQGGSNVHSVIEAWLSYIVR